MALAFNTFKVPTVSTSRQAPSSASFVLHPAVQPASCGGMPIQRSRMVSTLRRNVIARVVIKSRMERADADIEKVLFTTEQLNEILDDLGRQIGRDYENKSLLVLGVLKGGFMFTADLIRHINPVPEVMDVDFFKAASYGMGNQSSGLVKLDDAFDLNMVKDRHILLCEDIIDTGLTMSSIVKLLRAAGAMSVRVCCLLDKRSRRKFACDADYVGVICPDEFVVGYGIDFAEKYRWLPYIGVPKPEVVDSILATNKLREEQQRAEETARDRALQRIQVTNGIISNGSSSKHVSNGNENGAVVRSNVVGVKGMKAHGVASNMGLPLLAKPVRK